MVGRGYEPDFEVVQPEPGDAWLAAALGPCGVFGRFINKRGVKLGCYFWPVHDEHNKPTQPKGVVIAVHGHASHVCYAMLNVTSDAQPSTYSKSWVEALNKRGYAVCGFDQQGFGRSAGTRGYVESFDSCVTDVVHFSKSIDVFQIPGFASSAPKFILGLSLGGAISTMAAHVTNGAVYQGAILLAPMIQKLRRAGKLTL